MKSARVTVNDATRDRLTQAVLGAGLTPGSILLRREYGVAFALIEVAGYVTDDDPRLAKIGDTARRPAVLGAYAEPIQGEPS